MKSNNDLARKLTALFAILAFAVLLLGQIQAQNRELVQEKSSSAQKRIALVIGNGNYTSARKLANPVNDATDMTSTLKSLGFEVISGVDLNLRQMKTKVREFGNRLRVTKSVGLFYYAGHGVQVKGSNFLIPVNAEIPQEDEVEFAALNLNFVMQKMATANNGLNIVILDACRNNPFERGWSRGADDSGLAQVSAPAGTFIAYATAPNRTASDGTGRNGLYTAELLKQLKRPGLKIEEAFKQVTILVDRTSGGKQIPWTSSSLRGDFYFAGAEKSELPKEIAVTARNRSEIEREAWLLIQKSNNPNDFRFFLREFPNGAYQRKARIKLEQTVWDSIKNSNDKSKIQTYLNEFPNGANTSLARVKLRQLTAKATPTKTDVYDSRPGNVGNLNAGTLQRNSLGMEFAYIPAGEFMMGSANGEDDEKPTHRVRISEGLFMGIFEVTQEQWQKVMGNNPSYFKDCGNQCPVEAISWYDVQEFIRKLNSQTNEGTIYRLPTEAEWEYAARAGTTGDYAGKLDSMAWYSLNSGSITHPVGQKSANPWGLYDMHGNVWEWVQDFYGEYSTGLVENPKGPSLGSARVVRGGSWFVSASDVRSANRNTPSSGDRYGHVGFRLVMTIDK